MSELTPIVKNKGNLKESSIFGKNNDYGWCIGKHEAKLHLGSMKNAVVISYGLTGCKYYISERSFFPFAKEVYKGRFDTIEYAIFVANKYVSTWISETNKALEL